MSGHTSHNAETHEQVRSLLVLWIPLVREVFKLIVIGVYLLFAICLLIFAGNPIGFLPLLPWALRSARTKILHDPGEEAPRATSEAEAGGHRGSAAAR